MDLDIVLAYEKQQEIGTLFREYAQVLIEADPFFEEYLADQSYEDEFRYLDADYGLPEGRIYIAYCDGRLAGCIGLHKMDEKNCEMKRLYIRPEFRGKKIGKILVEKIIGDARSIGYQHMLLETVSPLQSAVNMYQKFGFYQVKGYNANPLACALFMKMDL